MKSSFWAIIVFFISVSGFAQMTVDRLVLKDGSIFNGVISKQTIGSDIQFSSYSFEIFLEGSKIQNCLEVEFSEETLPEEWRTYYSCTESTLDNKKFVLSKITASTDIELGQYFKIISDKYVQVLERGYKYKVKGVSPSVLTFNVSDISRIERVVNDIPSNVTLDEIVTKEDSPFRGRILFTIPNTYLQILEENGRKYNVPFTSILEERKIIDNKELTIKEKIPYYDVITTRDNRSFKGVISVKYYGEPDEKPYLVITDLKGRESRHLFVEDILYIEKVLNPNFLPNSDSSSVHKTELKEIVINDKRYQLQTTKTFPKYEGSDSCLVVEIDSLISINVVLNNTGSVFIQVPEAFEYADFDLYEPNYGKFSYKDYKALVKDSNSKKSEFLWVENNTDRKEKIVLRKSLTKNDGNTVIEYCLEPSKVYFFLYRVNKTCAIIKTF